jgi:hypothetical protein
MKKRDLQPLISLDDLRKVVSDLVQVPKRDSESKTKIVKPRPKTPRRDKKARPKRGRGR